ncbi:Inosine-5'-monophosphate dehydrogenase [Candidatus Gugararchaeum adminiculabundum]|nr:Inosine-5'-monophosphate dehydrogenase [Candidatus Gugararchaeum adminiculabundum]
MAIYDRIRKVTVFDADEDVAKVINALGKTGTCVVIAKGRDYKGIVDDRCIEFFKADPSKTKVDKVAIKAPIVKPEHSLLDLVHLFFAGRFKALPFYEGKLLKGVITKSDVLAELIANNAFDQKPVADVMSRPALAVVETTTIAQARALMRDHNVRRIVITRNGKIAGILSTFDLAAATNSPKEREPLVKTKASIDDKTVASFMREEVETIGLGAGLHDAARQMVAKDISALVVVDNANGKPMGVITARDLFETTMIPEEPDVYISGLHDSEKENVPEIKDECKKLLDRVGKSLDVQYMTLHIKNHGNRYSARARLATGKNMFNVSATEYGIMETVKHVLEEIRSMVAKEKPQNIHHLRG